jgi:hypothetical protein
MIGVWCETDEASLKSGLLSVALDESYPNIIFLEATCGSFLGNIWKSLGFEDSHNLLSRNGRILELTR